MGSFFSSFAGWVFDGCWHQYTVWEGLSPKENKGCQFRTCVKCGHIEYRTTRAYPTNRGGHKPKKPDSLPKSDGTPVPPTSGRSGD